jgi:hypothetical protein
MSEEDLSKYKKKLENILSRKNESTFSGLMRSNFISDFF